MNKDTRLVMICCIISVISIGYMGYLTVVTQNKFDDIREASFTEDYKSDIPCTPGPVEWEDGLIYWPQGAVLCEEWSTYHSDSMISIVS